MAIAFAKKAAALGAPKYIADVTPVATPPATQVPDEQIAKAQALKQQLEASLQQLGNSSEYSQYLSMEDQAKLAQEKALIEADLALLNTFLETGVWDPAAEPQVDIAKIQAQIAKMETGWNDMQGKITPAKIGKNTFEITLATSGVYDPLNPSASNALAFVVPNDAKKIVGATVGSDIQITVYKTNGSSEVYLLKGMAVRPEPIYIYGAQKTSAMEVDLTKAYRISNGQYGQPFGDTNGFIVWGTKSHDKIVGSEGNDVIVGGGGNDLLRGLMGDDELYGDEYGVGKFQATDGDDDLDGNEGMDTVRGGGGSKDKAVKGTGDSVAEAEQVNEEQFAAPTGDWLSHPNWTKSVGKNGEITLTLDDDEKAAGSIDLTLPPGYTMASGSMDSTGKALIVTMVGFDSKGNPQSVRVRINDFFDPDVKTTLNVYGNTQQNILDFHEVVLTGNLINLRGEGENDMILAPKSHLDELGIDLADLGKGTYSNKELKKLVDAGRDPDDKAFDWGGYTWNTIDPAADPMDNTSYVQDGEIRLVTDGTIPSLAFNLPAGFNDSVLMEDGKDYKLILINRTPDSVQQVVVRIVGGVDKVKGPITMNGVPVPIVSAVPIVDGGVGKDTYFGSASSVHFSKVTGEDTVVEGTYDFQPPPPPPPVEEKPKEKKKPDDDKDEEPAETGK